MCREQCCFLVDGNPFSLMATQYYEFMQKLFIYLVRFRIASVEFSIRLFGRIFPHFLGPAMGIPLWQHAANYNGSH